MSHHPSLDSASPVSCCDLRARVTATGSDANRPSPPPTPADLCTRYVGTFDAALFRKLIRQFLAGFLRDRRCGASDRPGYQINFYESGQQLIRRGVGGGPGGNDRGRWHGADRLELGSNYGFFRWAELGRQSGRSCAAVLIGGSVWLTGGDVGGAALRCWSGDLYDWRAVTWAELRCGADRGICMTDGRWRGRSCAAVLIGGSVWLTVGDVGGAALRCWSGDLYDWRAVTWAELRCGADRGICMTDWRWRGRSCAAVLIGGSVWLTGGDVGGAALRCWSGDLYDWRAVTWAELRCGADRGICMTDGRWRGRSCAAVLIGGSVWLTGGAGDLSPNESATEVTLEMGMAGGHWLHQGTTRTGTTEFSTISQKTTIFLLGSTKQTRNGILYYDMEAIWKRAQSNWKCHIEKIPPPEFFRLIFPSTKQDWLHGFKDCLIAQKGPPRRTLLIPKMGSKMSRLPIWVTFANSYVSQRQMSRLQKLAI